MINFEGKSTGYIGESIINAIFWGFILIGICALFYWIFKSDEMEKKRIDAMTECERVEYKKERAFSAMQARNAILEKQNLIMQGKCLE